MNHILKHVGLEIFSLEDDIFMVLYNECLWFLYLEDDEEVKGWGLRLIE